MTWSPQLFQLLINAAKLSKDISTITIWISSYPSPVILNDLLKVIISNLKKNGLKKLSLVAIPGDVQLDPGLLKTLASNCQNFEVLALSRMNETSANSK